MHAALQLQGIRKNFGGFVALDGADFSAQRGEIHALLGENGAGKSSLMYVAAGLYTPEAGQLRVNGAVVAFKGPLDAAGFGIGMIHQHYKLVRPLTVAENVLLCMPARSYRAGLRQVERAIEQHSRKLEFAIAPGMRVDALSVAEQQRVEILKALIAGAEILILDEPTAVLTDAEAARLLATMRTLATDSAAVVLVTHKLRDVLTHADQVTLMRAGRSVACCAPGEVSADELAQLVVGAAAPVVARASTTAGSVRLRLEGLRCARTDGHVTVDGLALEVRAGEVYGIAGVGGNGQSELVDTLLGMRNPLAGRILVEDAGDIANATPRRRRDLGFAAIPADRQTYALASSLSISENYAVIRLRSGRFGSWAWVDRGAMRAAATEAMREFEVRSVRALEQNAGLLSGGNAQKLVIAREFVEAPRVVVAQSPSRGLDIRACADVHRRLIEARSAGAAVQMGGSPLAAMVCAMLAASAVSLLFGCIDSLIPRIAAAGIRVPQYFMLMTPYLITLAVMIWTATGKHVRNSEPAALGTAYAGEERR